MSSFCLHASLEALAPLSNSIVDDPLVRAIPDFKQALLQIVYIMDCCLVDSVLHHAPQFIVDRIQIWAVRSPLCGINEVWRLSCQHFNGLLGSVGWGTVLLKKKTAFQGLDF